MAHHPIDHIQPTSETPSGETNDAQNSSMVELLNRLHAQEAHDDSIGDRLVELYTAGDQTQFDNELRQAAIGLLRDTDPEFITNIQIIRNHNAPQQVQQDTAARQRQKLDDMKARIVETLGLPTEAHLTEMQLAADQIQQRIAELVRSGEITEPEDILRKLGILTTSYENHRPESSENKTAPDPSKEHFAYPFGLFPKSVNEKWNTYLEAVVKHLQASNLLQTGEASQSEVMHADMVREKAHDSVTKDVHQLLGLDNMGSESAWTLQHTRRMVGKMRDARFPTIETAEAAVAGLALTGESVALSVLDKLSRQRHDH